MPRRYVVLVMLVAAAAGTAVGCALRCVPPEVSKERHLVDLSAAPDAHAPISPGLLKSVSEEFRRQGAIRHPRGTKPYAFLAMSGGGVYGAFGAGLLNGWTASGNRPEFDVVTGNPFPIYRAIFGAQVNFVIAGGLDTIKRHLIQDYGVRGPWHEYMDVKMKVPANILGRVELRRPKPNSQEK